MHEVADSSFSHSKRNEINGTLDLILTILPYALEFFAGYIWRKP
jgi:hypothetical protein